MFKHIVVPLDGSALAEQALSYVRLLARESGSSIELLAVVAPPLDVDVGSDLERMFHGYLSKAVTSLHQDDLRATFKIVEGDAADQILSEAERVPDTLIAISTHGRSGLRRLVMGSIADRVVHHAVGPVLVLRPQASSALDAQVKPTTVIVPLDGSALAEQALPVAHDLVRAFGLGLVLVRSVPMPMVYVDAAYGIANANLLQEALEARQKEAKAYLDRVVEIQKHAGVAQVSQVMTVGHPAEAILDFARSVPGSIVVMTSHGRSGIRRWLLGSVADHVIRHSDAPVLLVRASQAAETKPMAAGAT